MPREKSKKMSQLKKSSDKPFECDLCHKRYSYRQSLRNHKRIHTDRNPYKCNGLLPNKFLNLDNFWSVFELRLI